MTNPLAANKFLIFSQPRSGTTLLQTLLVSHPDIKCDGELLNPNQKHKYSYLIPIFRYFPFPFVYRQVQKSQQSTYGFKLMTSHLAFLRPTLTAFSSLGWKIVYLYRRNTLKQALSNLVANQTGYWHKRDSGPSPELHLQIDDRDLMSTLEKHTAWCSQEIVALAPLAPLRLCYEDDLQPVETRAPTLERVFAFLRVSACPVHSNVQPTYEQPYSKIITNYDELIETVVRPAYGQLAESWLADS